MPPPIKRRKVANSKPEPAQEITFDSAAREDFLTGFHKRKLQRAKHAQGVAERKAKEEKREQRKKMREERHAGFQKAMEEHRKRIDELNASSDQEPGRGSEESADDSAGEEEEWNGIPEPVPVDYEAEYIDEDKYTTVTVEEVDPSKRYGFNEDGQDRNGRDNAEGLEGKDKVNGEKSASKTPSRTKENANRPKKKKKKFTYENKAERKITRRKEQKRNANQASARRSKS